MSLQPVTCCSLPQARRAVGATGMNERSSRSHAVVSLTLVSTDVDDPDGLLSRSSKLHLIDLAGSERQKDTQSSGERLREGAQINLSLSALGNVINALSEKHGRSRGRFTPFHAARAAPPARSRAAPPA